mmetsp:Transcript_17384/g.26909  ORF Transcript_17384/g.26909 Transcript_17384/m.26909 type:complete len:130 (+) Transcript_17384:283-672(+)
MFAEFRQLHEMLHMQSLCTAGDSWCTLGPAENYSNWTPAGNSWQPNSSDPGDNWTGANNPFGPKIPLGAHGAFGSAPPANGGGWTSGECNTNGQAQCGSGPAPAVTRHHGWGVVDPTLHPVQPLPIQTH